MIEKFEKFRFFPVSIYGKGGDIGEEPPIMEEPENTNNTVSISGNYEKKGS